MDSILSSVKTMLGLDPNYTPFDAELIMHINAVLIVLWQMGVGDEALTITSDAETWDDLLEDDSRIAIIKSYIYMKVRFIFDPPSGAAKESMQNLLNEYEWRISVEFGGSDE